MTHGVFEQEIVIVWTDYATLSPFLMTLITLIQILYGLSISKTVRNRNISEFRITGHVMCFVMYHLMCYVMCHVM